jgi:hypothetical protein
MSARPKTPKPAPDAAALPPLSPESRAALDDLKDRLTEAFKAAAPVAALKDLVRPDPDNPAWDLNLIAALTELRHPAVGPLLVEIFGASPDKGRRKALKRALYRLKSQGLPAPEIPPAEEGFTLQPAGRPPVEAFVTQIVAQGERYVVLTGPREFLGGSYLVARINDRQGFQEFHLLNLKPKQKQELWDHFRHTGMGEPLSVPPAHAVRLLEEACRLNPKTGPADRYLGLKERLVKHWGLPEDAPDLISQLPPMSETEEARALDQSKLLAETPAFQSWLAAPQEIAPFMQKVKDAEESPLVLSGVQRQTRMEAVAQEASQALYPPEERPLLARRLLEMAYCLLLRGEESWSRAARAASQDLTRRERSPLSGPNPFLSGLIWHSLRLAWELFKETEEAVQDSSLVAPPDRESPLLRR